MSDDNSEQQKVVDTGIVGDMGVALTRLRCGQMGLIFREQPTHDRGVDAEIEIVRTRVATGQIIKAQIKCGSSYFARSKEGYFEVSIDADHYEYWSRHSVPVIFVLANHETEECFWELISEETTRRTGKNYLISVPRMKMLTQEFSEALAELATPLIPSKRYETFSEDDQSTGAARRLAHYVKLNARERGWNKADIRQVIRQVTVEARNSQYFGSEIVRSRHAGRNADVVWVYVYFDESHRESGAYVARAMWVSEELEPDAAPIEFNGEELSSGLVVEWNDNLDQLLLLLDLSGGSKAEYLAFFQPLMPELRQLVFKYVKCVWLAQSVSYSEFQNDAETMQKLFAEAPNAPAQCRRLSSRLAELEASFDNARIYSERLLGTPDPKRADKIRFDRYIEDAFKKLGNADYEIELLLS